MRSILILFVIAICSTGCPIPDNCSHQDFKLTIPLSLTPRLDTFHIGDTFWLKSHIPSLIFDSTTRKEYSFLPEFEQIQYGIFSNITDSIENAKIRGSDNFDYFTIVGTAQRGRVGPGKMFQFKYKKTPGQSDSLVVGFVPRVPGIYVYSTSILTEEYRRDEGVLRRGCSDAVLLYYSMNDRIDDGNYDFIKPYSFFKYPYDGYIRDGSYAFWVVE
jgi:hypothetical protein